MRIGQRKYRQESVGRPAAYATAAANPNPVVMLVVRLFAPPAMTDNRILFTNRAAA